MFIRSLAGNRVTLIDAPCGARAAALSFLANIAALRERDVLPREPLDIRVLGISETARNYANELYCEMRPSLKSARSLCRT